MYDSDNKKSNSQKLAETLKRCGLASSVSQAHQMAGEITSTEQKVQSFFDIKKNEMKNDLMKTVHPNREEFISAKSNDVVSAQIQTYRDKNARQMLERAKNPQPLKIQVDFETPAQSADTIPNNQEQAISLSAEEKPQTNLEVFHDVLPEAPKIEVFHDDIPEHKAEESVIITPKETVKIEDTAEKEDYINKFVAEQTAEMETPKEAVTIAAPAAEKEDIIKEVVEDVKPVEEVKKPYTLPPQRPSMPQTMGPHPKTGQPMGIDIHNFFNFQKKGKL